MGAAYRRPSLRSQERAIQRWYLSVHFFFQAEDGIRDKLVTGVQTCALPISQTALVSLDRAPPVEGFNLMKEGVRMMSVGTHTISIAPKKGSQGGQCCDELPTTQIGRASCRERV